ncbi:hypothetical protein [uncultured Dubosiella sp.]|nr:hypothetical protein [uncultured Dubosiella sp.]
MKNSPFSGEGALNPSLFLLPKRDKKRRGEKYGERKKNANLTNHMK